MFILGKINAQYSSQWYKYIPEPKIEIGQDEEILKEVTLQSVDYNLSNDEMGLLYWMYFARKYPKIFYDKVIVPYVKTYPDLMKKDNYAKTLKRELYEAQPLPLLKFDKNLLEMAREHTKDVRRNTPGIAHNSSDGLSFQQRVNKHNIKICAGENLSYSPSSILMQLIMLYLDIDEPEVGHRKNLMNSSFARVGLSIIKLDDGEVFFVQDFSCSLQE